MTALNNLALGRAVQTSFLTLFPDFRRKRCGLTGMCRSQDQTGSAHHVAAVMNKVHFHSPQAKKLHVFSELSALNHVCLFL